MKKGNFNPRNLIIILGMLVVYFVCTQFFDLGFAELCVVYGVLLVLFFAVNYVRVVAIFANLNFMKNNYEKAEKQYRFIVGKNIKLVSAYINYAIILSRKGEGKKAIEMLEKGKKADRSEQGMKNILFVEGCAYWVMREYDKAISSMEQIQSKFDYVSPQILTTLSYLYIVRGDYDYAKTLTERALEENKNLASGWDNLGQIAYRQNDFVTAKEMFVKAVELAPNLIESLFFLGNIYENEGKFQAAADYFEKAMRHEVTPYTTITKEEVRGKYEKYCLNKDYELASEDSVEKPDVQDDYENSKNREDFENQEA